LKAFASATASGLDVTDEAALVEAFGHPVRVVPGSSDNLKVTYPADLVLVEALLKARAT
jgi:2-C-methyl-D-erythritol 4-phosphate cytidylyltransferase